MRVYSVTAETYSAELHVFFRGFLICKAHPCGTGTQGSIPVAVAVDETLTQTKNRKKNTDQP